MMRKRTVKLALTAIVCLELLAFAQAAPLGSANNNVEFTIDLKSPLAKSSCREDNIEIIGITHDFCLFDQIESPPFSSDGMVMFRSSPIKIVNHSDREIMVCTSGFLNGSSSYKIVAPENLTARGVESTKTISLGLTSFSDEVVWFCPSSNYFPRWQSGLSEFLGTYPICKDLKPNSMHTFHIVGAYHGNFNQDDSIDIHLNFELIDLASNSPAFAVEQFAQALEKTETSSPASHAKEAAALRQEAPNSNKSAELNQDQALNPTIAESVLQAESLDALPPGTEQKLESSKTKEPSPPNSTFNSDVVEEPLSKPEDMTQLETHTQPKPTNDESTLLPLDETS